MALGLVECQYRKEDQVSIEITHVRFGSTVKTHETIVRYKWRNEQNNNVDDIDKPSLVSWIDNEKGVAVVGKGVSRVGVHTVHPQGRPAYVQTIADGQWSNNLLSLPTF